MIIIHQTALAKLTLAAINEMIDASEVRVLYSCGTVQDFTDASELANTRDRIRRIQAAMPY